MLYGPLGAPGTGMVPKDAIKDKATRRGLADALDTLVVRHGGGGDVQAGDSLIGFKSYDQGREKWQGPTLDVVWFDEEPPAGHLHRGPHAHERGDGPGAPHLHAAAGHVRGRQALPHRQGRGHARDPDDHRRRAALHARAARAIIASYPAHERDARAKGIPTMGSGRVFPIEEEFVKCEAFEIPAHWPQIAGIDFGWDHPSAGARLAWDRDNDVLYVIAAHRAREQTPLMFAGACPFWGAWLPWAWPHDGLQHDKGSGEQLAHQYKAQGLKMLAERATFDDGSNGLEAGVTEMLDRMQTGRLKVFSHLNDWFEEFRLYHRKDGLIVKKERKAVEFLRLVVDAESNNRAERSTT
jgi:hypothetical protein